MGLLLFHHCSFLLKSGAGLQMRLPPRRFVPADTLRSEAMPSLNDFVGELHVQVQAPWALFQMLFGRERAMLKTHGES